MGGLLARPVDSVEIDDIFLIRRTLDGVAAGIAAQRGKPEDWTVLRRHAALIGAAIDEQGPSSPEFSEAHLSFHRAIYDIAFSRRLARAMANHVLVQLEVAAELSYADPAVALSALVQHQDLTEALASGDVGRAVAATDAHTTRSEAEAKRANPAL